MQRIQQRFSQFATASTQAERLRSELADVYGRAETPRGDTCETHGFNAPLHSQSPPLFLIVYVDPGRYGQETSREYAMFWLRFHFFLVCILGYDPWGTLQLSEGEGEGCP
jgi:hypothetical protein